MLLADKAPAVALILLTVAAASFAKGPAMSPQDSDTPASETPQAFSHADWQEVLQRFVTEEGFVDYRALAQDRDALDRYLEAVKTLSPESDPALFPTTREALAFYINAYNALVFEGVLARGPETESVWKGLVSGYSFFVKMKVVVGGEKMSLKTLEEKKILPVFKEPRVHAALNCASVGCPPLARDAYVPERLEAQLQAATERWINDPYHVRVDHDARTVYLNKIFDWFRGDFIDHEKRLGNPEPSLISFVNRFRPADAQVPESYSVRFSDYDKGINDV